MMAAAHPEALDHTCSRDWPYCNGRRCCSVGGYCGRGGEHCCPGYCAFHCPKRHPRHCPSPEEFPYYFGNVTNSYSHVLGKPYPRRGGGS
ncbi:unnamed protein product [Linum trigynum]